MIQGIAVMLILTSVAAMGFEPMTATITVSNGSLYDYIVIGQHPEAKDGFDNAYDIISPGNLNAAMGNPFIKALIVHPEWNTANKEFRGDTRFPAKRHEWNLSISSSLPAGMPLTVALQPDRSNIPKGARMILNDTKRKKHFDLGTGNYNLPAPGPEKHYLLTIITEQL